ncbi:tRNA (adenosine(37)-N6)-threonylcarbamoyltransferase complex ATPase subunit type 1 TsaE [Proteinivorax hydrogeniformans]|uniref:tRNA threonylcarbamoyladenosine biosynthesis protein TsaE n=1 Tax=Proteinivorax hydrogeniformans TaxID=1826727 RepID=A0AAU8HTC1_9FIRM
MNCVQTNSPEETYELGKSLAEKLKAGDVLLLSGDLGAGKTAFTKGVAWGLGIKDYVKSPTFTYVLEYNGKMPLFHFDLYRLQVAEEIYDLGFEDYLLTGGIIVLEWGERAEDILKQDGIEYIFITINKLGENLREVCFKCTEKGRTIAKELL